jgi:oxygen-independent coproporphyrinogen-3 oxidase
LGVSSIGRVGATYSQNAKTMPEYEDALAQGDFDSARHSPVKTSAPRGDRGLMCQGRVEFESIELAHPVKMREVLRTNSPSSAPAGDGPRDGL